MAPQARKNSGLPSSYKEDSTKGAMLRYEDSLPRLPVPSLEETSKRYLKSVHPLLSQAEFENTKMAVEAFVKPGAVGHTLQERLVKRASDPQHRNWLSEWWNNAAYLGYRDPIIPYVSYFYSHRDDRKRRDPAKRAAAITFASLEFKKQVDDGSLEPEYMKKLPMAMSSYHWMFNACRVPAKPADYPIKYPHQDHQYVLVIRKNAFFKIPTHHNGQQLSAKELEQQFKRVYQKAEKAPAIGVMTTENRDNWTDMRERLISSNPGNKATLQAIEAASFVICLDDATPVTLPMRSAATFFRKALTAHGEYISAASDGKGVDRHLFGLKKLLQEGEPMPEIFKDPAYTYSSSWYISSSQLSSEYYNGYGWSQVIDDGWGIAYMINEESVQFNIVSKSLGCERMAFFLNQAAMDIKEIMSAELKAKL